MHLELTIEYSWGTLIDTEASWYEQHKIIYYQRAFRFPTQVQNPTPNWELISSLLDPKVMGYAYCVLKDGNPIRYHSYGYSRGTQDSLRLNDGSIDPIPKCAFTADTRINLASVSKAICGIAVMKVLQKGLLDFQGIDQPFWPLIKDAFNPDPLYRADGSDSNVERISIRNC